MELVSPHSWMRLVESSIAEVSGASEVPQSRGKLIFQEAQLLCFCSKIDLDWFRSISIGVLSTSDNYVVRKNNFFKKI